MQFMREFAIASRVKTIRHGLIIGLSTLMSLAGCSPAEDADRTSELSPNEIRAYRAALKAGGNVRLTVGPVDADAPAFFRRALVNK